MHTSTFLQSMLLRTALSTLVTGVVFFAAAAEAQPINVPSSARPERIEERFRQDQRPAVSPDGVIEDKSAPLLKEGDLREGVRFKLQTLTVEGNTVFDKSELEEIYGQYVGQEITLNALRSIANSITVKYRNEGYILTRAIVPPQRINDGNVVIRVVEGFVNNIEFRGVDSSKDKLLQAYAAKIKAAQPLNAKDLERYVLLMEDLPGASARAAIQPSPTVPGASDLIITFAQDHFEGGVTLDNRGSRYLGPIQTGLTLTGNDLIFAHDRTQFRSIITALEPKELKYLEFSHEQQLGSEGTKLVMGGSVTTTRPGSKLEPLNIHGLSHSLNLGVNHPFLRSRKENIFGGLTYNYRDADAKLSGVQLYDDKLHVVRLNGSYDFVDSLNAINRFEAIVSQGLGLDKDFDFGRSRANGEVVFAKLNLEASRLQPVRGPWSIYAAATAQLSDSPLLASEEFGVGGATFGSAYDPSEITGDSGLAGRLEFQYNGDFASNWLNTYQIYAFYDAGKVWNRGSLPGESPKSFLNSMGIGTRFNSFDNLSGDVQLAIPISREVAANGQDGDAPRLFVSLSYRF